MPGLSPFVNNISMTDSYGRPLDWGSGPMSLQGGMGGVGNYIENARNYDANLSQAMQGSFVDPRTGQMLRQPTTAGQAASAADGLEAYSSNRNNSINNTILNMLGYGGTAPGGGSTGGGGGFMGSSAGQPSGAQGNSVMRVPLGSGPQGPGGQQIQTGRDMHGTLINQATGEAIPETPQYGAGGRAPDGGFTQQMGMSSSSSSSGGYNSPFRQAFEEQLMHSMQNPGMSDRSIEGIINKGTDEIAESEKNSLNNLQNKAESQGIGGGAVSAGNREVLSGFAGQRANLARDTRISAEKERNDQLLGTLNAGANYFGRLDDNARSDRNALISALSGMRDGGGGSGGGGGGSGGFSGLMATGGRNGGLAYGVGLNGTADPNRTNNNTGHSAGVGLGAFGEGTGGTTTSGFGASNSFAGGQGPTSSGLSSRFGAPALQGQGGILGFSSNQGGGGMNEAAKRPGQPNGYQRRTASLGRSAMGGASIV